MPIINKTSAKAIGYPFNKWVLHRILIDKNLYNEKEAIDYMRRQKKIIGLRTDTANYYSFNQHNPEITGSYYKTVELKNGILYVFQIIYD